MPDLLAEAMQDLYAADPDAFMDTRKRLVAAAKANGVAEVATEIGRLRKPSIAAWAVNLAARRSPGIVAQLVDLGTQMRTAQSRLDTATLTGLRQDRDRLLRDFVGAAQEAASSVGRRLSPAAQEEVRATVIAALADGQATQAVASGQLTRALSYSGFGEVDLSEAVARTSSGAILTLLPGTPGTPGIPGTPGAAQARGGGGPATTTQGDEGSEDATGSDRVTLEAALADAVKRLASAEESVTRARERAEETRERLAVVERQLAKAREADERALEGVTDAVRARKAAEAARHSAERALADAKTES
jgi:hypothetical protein